MEQISSTIRDSYKANAKELKAPDLEDFEKQVALKYAKDNNLWFKDILEFGTPTNAGGNEHTIVHNEKEDALDKSKTEKTKLSIKRGVKKYCRYVSWRWYTVFSRPPAQRKTRLVKAGGCVTCEVVQSFCLFTHFLMHLCLSDYFCECQST